jgi:hypothetical protein
MPTAHELEADEAARCGGPRAYTRESLLLEELTELASMAATLLQAARANSELPLSDARLLRGKAQWLESLAERASIDRLRSVPVVLPGSAEDKARQRVVTR